MKINFVIKLFISFIVINSSQIFPWGEEGHKLISKKAIEFLPKEMEPFKQWANYISEHSIDPDTRKEIDSTEGPKHYIDIDYYTEFLNGKMIKDKQQLISVYGDSIVNKMGLLPWATLQTFENLKQAFKEKNRDKILIFASDLSHYVEDGHQPMHTMLNYDGQLTNQKGIHARYEINMVDSNLTGIMNSMAAGKVSYVDDVLFFIFNYLTNANSVSDVLFAADKFAFNVTGSRENNDYYRLLWFRTKYITCLQFNSAATDLASLIYSAWVDGGKPSFRVIK
jgi:hypothetical protein